MLQAKFTLHVRERMPTFPPGPQINQPLLGQIQVFQVRQVLNERFPDIEGLVTRAPCARVFIFKSFKIFSAGWRPRLARSSNFKNGQAHSNI